MIRTVSVTVAAFGLSNGFLAYSESMVARRRHGGTHDFMENVLVERPRATHVPLCIGWWCPMLEMILGKCLQKSWCSGVYGACVGGEAHLNERTDLIQVEEGQHLESSVDYRMTLSPEAAFRLPE